MKYLLWISLIAFTLALLSSGCKNTGQAVNLDPGRRLQPGQTLFSEGVSGGLPALMPHAVDGYTACTSCHYLGTAGAVHLVNEAHACDECHILSPMPHWEHGMPDDGACIICHVGPYR